MNYFLALAFAAPFFMCISAQNPLITYPLTPSDIASGHKIPEIIPPEKPGMPQTRIPIPAERLVNIPPSQAATRATERASTEARAALEGNVKTDEYTPAS